MKPRHIFLLLAVAVCCALTGCSGGGDEGATNLNKDVQTGAPSAGLDGAAPAGGAAPMPSGGETGGGGPSTPASTP